MHKTLCNISRAGGKCPLLPMPAGADGGRAVLAEPRMGGGDSVILCEILCQHCVYYRQFGGVYDYFDMII